MEWIEAVVRTTTSGAELVSQILIDAGAGGVWIEDRADVAAYAPQDEGSWLLIDEELLANMDEDVLVKGYFPKDAAALERIAFTREGLELLQSRTEALDVGKCTLEIGSVDEEDWANEWKKYFKPFKVADRIVIKPSWEAYTPSATDLVVEMDPGMAFGTGTHETTALCIAKLEQTVSPGDTVIDVGCGTGILGICAALLGAQKVIAIDIDANAVRVASENVSRNHLSDRIQCLKGDLVRDVSERCDVMVSNIIADIIILLAEPAYNHIRPLGQWICSGIIKDREQDVRDALASHGFVDIRRDTRGEWVVLIATRPED